MRHHRAGADRGEPEDVVAAVRRGDEATFTHLVELYRNELRVHCYRMLGRYDEAEDLVQEAFARAWRGRAGFEGRATVRAWLYRIATNACLDALKRNRRRPQRAGAAIAADRPRSLEEVPWLQPFPDRLLDELADTADPPEAVVVANETIELAYLAAIQHLPARQRAVLVLRDALGWSAAGTAEVLGSSVAAVNSALQRARATLRELDAGGRMEWVASTPTENERELLQRYMEAHERADAQAVIDLLGEDVIFTMPPWSARYEGRDAVAAFFRALFGPDGPGAWRLVPTRANRRPAAANYVRGPGEEWFRATTFDVLHIAHDHLVEVTTFGPDVFAAFGLPDELPPGPADAGRRDERSADRRLNGHDPDR